MPSNETGTARSGLGADVATGAAGSAGRARVAWGDARRQGAGASSTSPRVAVPIGGAATVRPSSLHIGTAALASALTSKVASTSNAWNSRERPRRVPIRLKTRRAPTSRVPKAGGFYPRPWAAQPRG